MTADPTNPIARLPPYDESTQELNVIVECPRGSSNKYAFDPEVGLFKLKGILPLGFAFPFDFGFIPGTRGGDGDPLDILILMDEPAFPGCLVPCRAIGVIEAEQTENDTTERNDRLIAVAASSRTHLRIKTLNDLNPTIIDEIEDFFISYNEVKGKSFKPIGRFGNRKAHASIEKGIQAVHNSV